MMTNNKQFSQTPPDKVNELFAKLLDTSDGAVKTREQLFSDLRAELELLASIQEEHLFPVLRKHKETRDLVPDALNDNMQTRALLDELENTPKDSEEFARKIEDLRRVFQQHIRDDRKELLPVVLKVLSEQEVDAVVESIEGEIAEAAETKQAEAEERRVATRRNRKQLETAQKAAEGIATAVRVGAEQGGKLTRTAQEALQSNLATVSEAAQQSTGQAIQLFGLSGSGTRELADQTLQNLRAVARSNGVLLNEAQDATWEWLGLSQKRLLKNLDGMNALMKCRTVQDLVAVQSSLIRDNLEQTIESSRRIAERTLQVTETAAQTLTTQASRIIARSSSAA
jgi:hypothetical protein